MPDRTLEAAIADENTVAHYLTMTNTGGGWYVMPGGKYLDFAGNWKMADTARTLKVYTPTVVEITGERAETVFSGTADKPMSQDAAGSTSFRVPGSRLRLGRRWARAAGTQRPSGRGNR